MAKMRFSKVVFLAVDVLFKHPQNPRRLYKKYSQGVICEKDVVFDETIPDIKLDAYHVERTEGKYPVIFEIHGGGFSAGDKKYRTVLCNWFAKETGAYVFNVNYGLGGDIIFPDPLIHLVKAFNWVVANAEKYNLDLDKMIVTGDSAGAYYSAALSVYNDCPAMQEACKVPMNGRFSAAVLNCGIYDLQLALGVKVLFNLTDQVCQDFSGIIPKDFETYPYKEAVDPINYVTDKFPKSMIVYSEQDIFCGGQGEALIKKLHDAGVYEEHYVSKKFLDNHTFPLIWFTKAAKQANKQLMTFMKRFFNGEI